MFRIDTTLSRPAVIAAAALCVTAGAAIAQPPAPFKITNPDWIAKPSNAVMIRAMPPEALNKGKHGETTLACTVTLSGLMKDCVIVDEDPKGYGFGSAALSVSSHFQMRPQIVNGKAQEAQVFIPIRWRCNGCNVSRSAMKLTKIYSDVLWEASPSYAQWAAAYPAAARAAGTSGAVSLRCKFASEGRLSSCDTQTESPKNQGFGKAAVSLTPFFKGAARDGDGEPTMGGLVNVQIAFPKAGLDLGRGPGAARLVSGFSRDAVTAAYPPAATRAGVTSGRVIVACKLGDTGEVAGCETVSEAPANLGFADAAGQLAKQLRYSLWSEDGQPVNRNIAIPITFDAGGAGQETSPVLIGRLNRQIAAGEADAAMDTAAAIISRFGSDREAMQSAGVALARLSAVADYQENPGRALRIFDAAIAVNPRDVNALSNRCWLKATADLQADTALADCNRALAIDPNSAKTLNSRGMVYFKRAEFAQALASYEASLSIRPDDAHTLYGRGMTKLRLGDRRGGDADIAAALKLNRRVDDAYARLGVRR